MCFSAEADLIAGAVIGGAGLDALRHVGDRRQVGVAALPLVFGAHQMVEAFTWWGLEGKVPATVGEAAMWAYLVVAFVLPFAVPVAVVSLEEDPGRRRAMVPFAALGAAVTAVLLVQLVTGPVSAEIGGRYVAYHVDLHFGGQLTALYVAATCIPLLLSSVPRIVVFGVLNLVAVVVLAWLMASGIISLWCAWAAVTSLLIVLHLRRVDKEPARAAVGSAGAAGSAG